MAFVPIPINYTLGDSITLRLGDTSGTDISSTTFVFYIIVNNSSIQVGQTRGSLTLTTQLSSTAISAILNVSKSANTSTSSSWATWYATANGVSTSSPAAITVTIPPSTYYPKISGNPTFKDTLNTTKTLTGDEAKIVLNASTLSVTATIVNNSTVVNDPTTITSWAVKNGSKISSGSGFSISASITKPTSSTVTITIVNGRGVTKIFNYTLSNYVDYKIPTASITSLARTTSDMSKVTIKYTVSMFTGSFGATSNTATITTKSGELSNGTVSTWSTVDTKTNFASTSYTKTLSGYTEDTEYGFKGTLQDALNTINITQVNLPVALPVLALSPDMADLFGTFHIHNRNNTVTKYLDIQQGTNGGIFRTRAVSDNTILNYIYLYDDRLTTAGDIVANGIYLLDSLFYKDGDTATLTNMIPIPGYITTNSTEMRFNVTVGKSLKNVSTVTVNSMYGLLRGVAGYVEGNSNQEWVGKTGVTISANIIDYHSVKVSVNSSSALSNATNNSPVIFSPSGTGLVLEFGGS